MEQLIEMAGCAVFFWRFCPKSLATVAYYALYLIAIL